MYPYKGLSKELYILFISRIINSMGTFVFPMLAFILTQKIGFTKGQAGSFITLLAISQVPGMLIGGKLVDSFGRKKIIVIFQGLGTICYLICAFLKPSIIIAIIIIIASSFYGMASPAFDAVSADLTTVKNRKGAFSLLYMGHNIGFSIASVVGGILYKKYLPLIFIGDAITTILSITLFAVFIKETMNKQSEEKQPLVQAINLEQDEEGSVIKVLLKRPILLYFALIMFVYQFAYSQWGFTLPLQMGDVFGSNGAKFYGFLGAFNGAIVIIFTPIVTNLIHKLNPMRAMAYGGFLYAIAFGMLAFINNLYFYFGSIFILTIGEIIIAINNGTFVANHTPASHRGRINSILPIITGSGFALGPVIMGSVMQSKGHVITWTIISLLVMVAGVLMIVLELKDKKVNLVNQV